MHKQPKWKLNANKKNLIQRLSHSLGLIPDAVDEKVIHYNNNDDNNKFSGRSLRAISWVSTVANKTQTTRKKKKIPALTLCRSTRVHVHCCCVCGDLSSQSSLIKSHCWSFTWALLVQTSTFFSLLKSFFGQLSNPFYFDFSTCTTRQLALHTVYEILWLMIETEFNNRLSNKRPCVFHNAGTRCFVIAWTRLQPNIWQPDVVVAFQFTSGTVFCFFSNIAPK